MAAIIRNILIGTAVISAPTIGNFVYWVNEKTKDLPANQKGSLFSRMQEAVNSFYQSKQIQDAYTAERHLDFATSLSSKEFTVSSGRAQQETKSLQGSYYAGYIPTALSQYSGIYPPIFRYDTDLPVILPTLPGQTHKGFVFAGASSQIHDSQAREAILNGTYLRCESRLEIVDPNEDSSWNKYKKVDVIITGTTDQRECSQFKKHYVRDIAYLAAMSQQPFNSEHPYSDTPVFDLSENGFKSTGDLTAMPQQTRLKIMVGNFTVCNFYSLMKTRLSLSDYKEVGAIVVGTLNEDVCQALSFMKI